MLHNAALREYRRAVEERDDGGRVELRTAEGVRVHPINGLNGPGWVRRAAEWERMYIDLICFADDTNMVHRESVAAGRRGLLTETMARWGSTVRPG
eukprot:6778805-Heterocapsa_arctica.AAC.1